MTKLFRSIRTFGRLLSGFFVGPTDPREQILEGPDHTIARAKKDTFKAIVLIIEIDAFWELRKNLTGKDTRHILQIIENRLKGDLLLRDVVRRLDGDQFAVAITPLRALTRTTLLDLAAAIQDAIARPIPLDNGSIQLTASVGCATSDTVRPLSGDDLLEAARVAQVEASHQGPSTIRVYSAEMSDRIAARKTMLNEALSAIKNGAIHAFFQPQICLITNEISGFEALARWNHQARGLISPAEFIPVLEEAGMMRHLGLAMLRDALRAVRSWDDAGQHAPCVSVNMSAHELRDPNLVDVIKLELDAFDLEPERLVIEVLETVVANGADDLIIHNLRAIADIGCGIDLDDFGTGHASITTIRNYAINRIKIDRSFVSHIDHDKPKQKMVGTILMIADSMSIESLAEGVETPLEIKHLSDIGCGHAQGFAIARPLPPAETIAWMQTRDMPTPKTANATRFH